MSFWWLVSICYLKFLRFFFGIQSVKIINENDNMKLIKVFSSGNEIWQIMKKIEQSNKMNIKQKIS